MGAELQSKGIDFGKFHVTYQPGVTNKFDLKTVIDFLDEHPGQNPGLIYFAWG